jgi:hypothetical protein
MFKVTNCEILKKTISTTSVVGEFKNLPFCRVGNRALKKFRVQFAGLMKRSVNLFYNSVCLSLVMQMEYVVEFSDFNKEKALEHFNSCLHARTVRILKH